VDDIGTFGIRMDGVKARHYAATRNRGIWSLGDTRGPYLSRVTFSRSDSKIDDPCSKNQIRASSEFYSRIKTRIIGRITVEDARRNREKPRKNRQSGRDRRRPLRGHESSRFSSWTHRLLPFRAFLNGGAALRAVSRDRNHGIPRNDTKISAPPFSARFRTRVCEVDVPVPSRGLTIVPKPGRLHVATRADI